MSFGLLIPVVPFAVGVFAAFLAVGEQREIDNNFNLTEAEADESTDPVVRDHLKWFRIYFSAAIACSLLVILIVALNRTEAQQFITDVI
jgi:hypothetical protein